MKSKVQKLREYARPHGLGFQIRKIGHVVLNCRDLERSVKFYTQVLGFQVSDVYPDEMVPGGMVFLRCACGVERRAQLPRGNREPGARARHGAA